MGIGTFFFLSLLVLAPWLFIAGITHSSIIFPILAFVILIIIALIRLYRPHENYVGTINMFGRYWRMVNPNQCVILIPLLQRIRCETSLGFRSTSTEIKDVLTHDNVPVNLYIQVYYRFDIRKVSSTVLIDLLGAEEDRINKIILTYVEDVVRNRALINSNYTSLHNSIARRNLELMLVATLSNQLNDFGIQLNQGRGIKIINLQPNEQFQKALCQLSAATALGAAMLERMQPLLKEMSNQYPNVSWDTVGMMLASTLAQDGGLTPVVIPPRQYSYVEGGFRPNIPVSGGNPGS
jgi:regulator of protease activity HflC (stomatin/prohibitin superfamily)